MARRARRALLARKRDEHLVPAVGAADAGEALVQIAALEKRRHGPLDDRPPEAVLGREALLVDLLEGLEMPVEHLPQAGRPRIAWAVERQGLDAGRRHAVKASQWDVGVAAFTVNTCTLVVKGGMAWSSGPRPFHGFRPRDTMEG